MSAIAGLSRATSKLMAQPYRHWWKSAEHYGRDSNVVRVLVAGGGYSAVAAAITLARQSAGERFPAQEQTKAEIEAAKRDSGREAAAIVKPKDVPVEVIMVSEKDGYYHLIGTPLYISSPEEGQSGWVEWKNVPGIWENDKIRVITGLVKKVDMNNRTATIQVHGSSAENSNGHEETTLDYDYFVAASGLRRGFPSSPGSTRREEYLKEIKESADKVGGPKGVVVIGGGAVGVEIAAETKWSRPDCNTVLVHSRGHLLSAEPLPEEFRSRILTELQRQKVEVVLNNRVVDVKEVDDVHYVKLQDGTELKASQVFWAMSEQKSTAEEYLPLDVLEERGRVPIQNTLNFQKGKNQEYHFAAGDLIKWTGIRRCGGAMYFGQLSAINIYEHILSQRNSGYVPQLRRVDPTPPMMGIAVGDTAVAYHPDSGVQCGEKQREYFFEDDLGFKICWRNLALAGSDASQKRSE